jgi:hypothetical protein
MSAMQATVGTEPTKLVAAPEISTAQKTCHAHPLSHRRPARVKATDRLGPGCRQVAASADVDQSTYD